MTLEIIRCPWANTIELEQYHDNEWGVPQYEDYKLFELLVLEMMQAGLSWLTILRKRENFRKAFDNFDYIAISKYDENKINELLNNEGIIRNKLKIKAVINNAKKFILIKNEFGSFSSFIWRYVDMKPVINNWEYSSSVPSSTELSKEISDDLLKFGFKFVGTKTIYSFMQASGMVNDHLSTCISKNLF